MSYAINNVTAPDSYDAGAGANVIENVPISRLIIDVTNQAIFWQLKIPLPGGGGNWDAVEQYMSPGSRVVLEPCAGIRVRAAIAAAALPAGTLQAQVTVRAVSE